MVRAFVRSGGASLGSIHAGMAMALRRATVPDNGHPVDFSLSAELIDRAHAGTRQCLGNGCPHAMPLVPHRRDLAVT